MQKQNFSQISDITDRRQPPTQSNLKSPVARSMRGVCLICFGILINQDSDGGLIGL